MASDIRTYGIPFGKIFNLCLSAMAECGWTITHSDETRGTIKAQSGVSLLSWGEDIEINLERDGISTKVKGSSEASQLIDWGKSSKNLDCFFSNLERLIYMTRR